MFFCLEISVTRKLKILVWKWIPCNFLQAPLSEGYCSSQRLAISLWCFNTLRPRQNERHFADDIFKCIFLNENVWIPIKISMKFVPKGPINNIPALVQIMAWGRPGDKPLSELMMVNLTTHICVTRPQWVKLPITHPEWGDWKCGKLLTKVYEAQFVSCLIIVMIKELQGLSWKS